jgi:aldose 1-epimerase
VDEASIPTGHFESVDGTPFDFRTPGRLGDRIRQPHPQIVQARGIDHAYHLSDLGMCRAARLEDPVSGRALEVHTDQPSLQVYTGNFLDGSSRAAGAGLARRGDGIALETQRHPDAVNKPRLGTATLMPGETYSSHTEWRFFSRP